jgi:hypothetical protein
MLAAVGWTLTILFDAMAKHAQSGWQNVVSAFSDRQRKQIRALWWLPGTACREPPVRS